MESDQTLLSALRELEDQHDGIFSVRVVCLDRDQMFCLREREILPTASTFKLFVLCELFRNPSVPRRIFPRSW